MHPVAFLIRKGATATQALAVIWGSGLSVAVITGLWFVVTPVAQALMIVIAVSAPRAILCLVAQWAIRARARSSRKLATGRLCAGIPDLPASMIG